MHEANTAAHIAAAAIADSLFLVTVFKCIIPFIFNARPQVCAGGRLLFSDGYQLFSDSRYPVTKIAAELQYIAASLVE